MLSVVTLCEMVLCSNFRVFSRDSSCKSSEQGLETLGSADPSPLLIEAG